MSVNKNNNPFPESYNLYYSFSSNHVFVGFFLLVLRDFMKDLRCFFIFVQFIGFLFSFYRIKILIGPIGFEILRIEY